jgi:Holliday junction resolvase RusA-like endonuclease
MIEELKVNIKPLSVNDAWKGKRYKSDAYKAYETEMLVRLPAGHLPEPPYRVHYEFGVSNRLADFDNPCKPLGDILQKKYGFNDKEIYEAHIQKVIVKKGNEYVKVKIEHISAD